MKRGDQIIYTLIPIVIFAIFFVPLFLLSFYSTKSKRIRKRIRDNPEVLRNNFIPLICFTLLLAMLQTMILYDKSLWEKQFFRSFFFIIILTPLVLLWYRP